MPDTTELIHKFFLFYLPLLFSLCVHEFAHGWTSRKLGDLTAFHQGRVTLNPVAHIDYIGTLFLPLFFLFTNSPIFFGWAKPVPVNPGAFKNPKNDMFWVAFAGPLSNFLLSFIGGFYFRTALYSEAERIYFGRSCFFDDGDIYICQSALGGL